VARVGRIVPSSECWYPQESGDGKGDKRKCPFPLELWNLVSQWIALSSLFDAFQP